MTRGATPDVEVRLLDPALEAAYTAYLLDSTHTLVYASLPYRDLLVRYLGASPRYFVARDAYGAIRGVLPAMLYRGQRLTVLNSLPFFGSNGGVLVHDGDRVVGEALLAAFHAAAEAEGCATATLITSPFEPDTALYEADGRFTLRDRRIGQITPLPARSTDVAGSLLARFADPRPRNIRRAIKAGVTVRRSDDADDVRFLQALHARNIGAIGGRTKDLRFFETVQTILPPPMRTLYVGELAGTPVAALLCLRFNRTVEYFTPALSEAHRADQPLGLVILQAMIDAVEDGMTHWNWGGTWVTQGGVYDFKRRWGTSDHRYHYFTRVLDADVLGWSREALLDDLPHGYVVPFSALR